MKQLLLWLVLLAGVLSLPACKKEIRGYEGAEGVYFAVQSGASWGTESTMPFRPYTNVEFVKVPQDTTVVNIKVMITGPVKNYDRPFKIAINPDSTTAQQGVHYLAIPAQVVIPANAYLAYVPVTLMRTPDLETDTKKIGLRLLANEHFQLSFPEWDALPGYTATTTGIDSQFNASLHTIRVNDFLVQPAVWVGSVQDGNREAGIWGAFTRKKIELMYRLFNLTYADFGSTTTMPSVRSSLIASEGGKYLLEQFNAGNPILEDDGRLMFIGSVPWTSYIGVKWVP